MNRYLALFLLFALTALAKAQEGTPQPVLVTWPDCVSMAAQNNPDLLAGLNLMEASHAGYKGSYNGIFPKVSLTNSYSENNTVGRYSQSWILAGNASLDLIDFSQWAAIQSSLAAYKESQATVRVTASNVLLNLYKAFTGVLYAQESIQVNTAIREAWRNNAQMVDLRYQSGRESKGNNMNTQAQFLQAQRALEASIRGLRVAQQSLNQAIGKDDFIALAVTGTWATPQAPKPRPDFTQALAQQPRIQVQEALLDQERAAIKSARSSIWPTLGLNYSKGRQGPTEFPTNPFWTFTGTVNYPLFGAGPTATYYASVAAERAYVSTQQDLRSLRNQILSDLESAWAAYVAAEDDVNVQRAFLQAAQQRKDESDVRYRSGLMTFEDWIILVQDYVNFQQSYLRAEQNLILAEAQWRFARGDQLTY